MTDKWQHLFEVGEYAPRRKILEGLTLEEVNLRPSGQLHSIYEELWHTATWQHIVIRRDEELYSKWQEDPLFPEAPAASLEEWRELVDRFFADLEEAYAWAASPERLNLELDPGETMEDALYSLAVHNAYHFGKIVALRQFMEAWPSG